MLELGQFQNLQLRGGFLLREVRLTATPLLDPIERSATAQTTITGSSFRILLRADWDEQELSISLYHEILEAATLGATDAPKQVAELNEADFETAARAAHPQYAIATPASLNEMLAEYGF